MYASPHRLLPRCLSPVSSLFDAPASRHLEVAKTVVEQAKRLVESRHDVAILLESITRLGRASSVVFPSRSKAWSGAAERLLSAPNASSRGTDPQIDPSCRARS
jgi:transcription termination factor Rho